MALTADEVRIAITGEVHVAPVGTTAPTSATSVLDPAFKGLGYNNDEGIVESFEESSEVIRAWQNNDAVRTVITESDKRFAFTLIQTNKDTLELYYKGSKVVSVGNGGHALYVIPPKSDPRAIVLDVIDGDDHRRIYIPRGEVVERGEIEYVGGAPVGYNVTISCTPVPMEFNDGDDTVTENVPFVMFSNSPDWGEIPSP